MSYLATLSLFTIFSTLLISTGAANFQVRNNCPYTVWAAAYPGGGRQLNPDYVWSFDVAPRNQLARIWGRTNCNFGVSGCETGDCNGQLQCTGYGRAPNTVAEFESNFQYNYDYYDISLRYGFNIPMEFGPTNNVAGDCTIVSCTGDTIGQCPSGTFSCPRGTNYKVVFCP